jgi:hypothetical protein
VPARNNTYPKERQNPTRISFLAEKCLKEDKTKKTKTCLPDRKCLQEEKKPKPRRHLPEKKMFARRRKTKPRRRRCLPKKCFLQEERQKNQ